MAKSCQHCAETASRLGAVEQGIKDLGRNFERFESRLCGGDGVQGWIPQIQARVQILEDARNRRAGMMAVLGAGLTLACGAAAAYLKHLLRWK